MIMLDDVLLPEPYDTPVHVCLSAYRAGRRMALKALREINKLVARVEAQCDEHEGKHPDIKMPALQQVELHRRFHFAAESARLYRQRLIFLRTYWRYAQAVHGPT